MNKDESAYKILIEMRAKLDEANKALGALQGLEAAVKENTQALTSVESSAKTAAAGVDQLGSSVGRSRELFLGFNLSLGDFIAKTAMKVPNALFGSIRAFGEQEMAARKLSEALKATGQDVGANLPILQELANEIQRTTTVADDMVLSMQSTATAMGISSMQMEETVKNAIGLSRAFNMDLVTATKAAAAAIQGKTELLSRYIPTLSEAKTEEEKLALVQRGAAVGYAQARAEAEELLGSIESMKNQFGDVAEIVGEAYAPAFRSAVAAMSAMANLLNSYPTAVKLLTVGFTNLAVAMAFTKIGGLKGIADGFKNVAASILGAEAATLSFGTALKGLLVANAPLLLITTALSALVYWYDKALQSRKALVADIEAAGAMEVERIKAETARIKTQGITDAKLAADQIAERIALLEKERKAREAILYDPFKGIIFGPEIKAIAKYQAEIKNLSDEIDAYHKQKDILEEEGADLEKKNVENLIKVKESHARAQADLNDKLQAEKDLLFARQKLSEKLVETEQKLADLEGRRLNEQDNARYAALGEQILKLTQTRHDTEKSLLETSEKIVTNEKRIADDKKRQADEADRLREAESNADFALAAAKAETEILRLKAAGNEEGAKQLKTSSAILKLTREYATQYKNASIYRGDSAKLEADAYKFARLRLELENSIAAATEEQNQAALESGMRLQRMELDVLRLKATGKKLEAEALETEVERVRLINDYKERYKEASIYKSNILKLDEDARKYAAERLDAEKRITEEQKNQERLKRRIADAESLLYRYALARAKLEGDSARVAQLEAMLAMQKEVQSLVENGWEQKAAERAVAAVQKIEQAAANFEKSAGQGGGRSSARTMLESNLSAVSSGPSGPKKPQRGISKARAEAEARGESFDSANYVPEYAKSRVKAPRQQMPSPKQLAANARRLEQAGRKQPEQAAQQPGPSLSEQRAAVESGQEIGAAPSQTPNAIPPLTPQGPAKPETAKGAPAQEGGAGKENTGETLKEIKEGLDKALEYIKTRDDADTSGEDLTAIKESLDTISEAGKELKGTLERIESSLKAAQTKGSS